MRVLHVGKYFPPVAGGMETFCGDLHGAFANSPVTSRMLVHCKPGKAPPATPGVVGIATRGELFFTPVAPGFSAFLKRQIEDFEPQVLHFHLPNPAAFWALRLDSARQLPWVLHWQSDVVASAHQWRLRLAYPIYAQLERRLVNRAHTIIATSPNYAAASPVLKILNKVRVIPLGIDPRRLLPRADPPIWPEAELRILAIGRLTYYKGFAVLLDALAKLPRASLVLLGDGAERNALARKAAKLGITDRVVFAHHADDAMRNAALAAADCLCLPSIERTEAFGLVLLEAMALELPVVATRIPGSGVPWVIETAGHGLLAEPENVDALVAALTQLSADNALYQRLQSNARNNFPSFHISRVAQQLEAVYADCARGQI